ncbi:hypothetical protein ACCO45_001923 [Purpureocillium lilacinum]|uniref:Uncharacterized protein n=1 Tax=Purpureocillium lilacinum TaxID=33203 RepID=A0ACC4EAY3_PURLI
MAQAPAAIAPVERAADRPPAVDCTRLAGLSLPCARAIGSRKQAGPGALANHHKWPPSRPMEACSVHRSSPAQLENPPGGVHPWRAVAEAHQACCWPPSRCQQPSLERKRKRIDVSLPSSPPPRGATRMIRPSHFQGLASGAR